MNNIFDISGKSILITGASSGLGRHFAQALAAAGAVVVATARREEALRELVAEIAGKGGKAHAVKVDVTDMASVRAGVAEAERLIGGLDGLIANSGIVERAPLLEQTEESWDRVIDTNLKGVWAVGCEVARAMVKRGKGGTIVNIASLLGYRQSPGNTAYSVSKAGVIQLTQQMALEWVRYGIRVNALAPGYFETDINRRFLQSEQGQKIIQRIPMARTGDHHELIGPLLLLLSEASSFMTGSTISVDGAHRINPV